MPVIHHIAAKGGVIDTNYTHEIKVLLANMSEEDYRIPKGDLITQLLKEKIVEGYSYDVHLLVKAVRGQ